MALIMSRYSIMISHFFGRNPSFLLPDKFLISDVKGKSFCKLKKLWAKNFFLLADFYFLDGQNRCITLH